MLYQVNPPFRAVDNPELTRVLIGMVGVGGFFIMGGGLLPHTVPQVLGALSVLLAFVNVSGGFIITKRMLDMFKRMLYDLFHFLASLVPHTPHSTDSIYRPITFISIRTLDSISDSDNW